MPGVFARFRGEVNDRYVQTFDGLPTRLAGRAADAATDTYWDAVGGPWIARYRRSALMGAIGIGKDVEKHFDDPWDALAHLQALPRRYRRDGLRSYCLVTYKDDMGGGGGWDAVEPFASDADEKMRITIAEIAAREGRADREFDRDSRQASTPRRIGGRKRKRTAGDGEGWLGAIAYQWQHPDSGGLGDGDLFG